jgi:hypothetical protein
MNADTPESGKSTAPRDATSRPPDADRQLSAEHTGGSQKKELGGRKGPEPTRYGDWEKDGRCIDF